MRTGFFLFLFLSCNLAFAGDVFDDIGNQHGVDPDLLRAIAMQESQMHEYALNCNGKSFYPKTKKEALRIFRSYGLICDIGYMQINYSWNGLRKDVSVDDLFEPSINIRVAAEVLKENMSGTKNVWKAVGRYHTWAKRDRAINYAWKVYDNYVGMN